MRSFVYYVAIAVVSVLAACAKKDNGTTAETPGNCNVPGLACNTQVYTQQGWSVPAPIPYSQVQTNGYCGCPSGTLPVYNQAWGIGCAPNNVGVYNQYVSYSTVYSGGSYITPQNTLPMNTPQQNYTGVNPGSCQNQLAYTCQVGYDAQCGAGNICRPLGGASAIGYCSNTSGVQNTTVPTGGYYNQYQNPYNQLPYGYPSGYVGYTGQFNGGYNGGYSSQCQLRTHQTNWGGWYQLWECDNTGANGVPR